MTPITDLPPDRAEADTALELEREFERELAEIEVERRRCAWRWRVAIGCRDGRRGVGEHQLASGAGIGARSATSGSTTASVVMTTSIVARPGASMPA